MDTGGAVIATESGNPEGEAPGEGSTKGPVTELDPGTGGRTTTEAESSGTTEERARKSRRQGGNPPEVVDVDSSRTRPAKRRRGEGGKAQL